MKNKNMVKVLAGNCLEIEVSVRDLIDSLNKIAEDHPELSNFTIEDDSYNCDSKDYVVYGYREETKEESEQRVFIETKRHEEQLAHKRWQLDKLKKELGED